MIALPNLHKRRCFSERNAAIVAEVAAGATLPEVAAKHGITPQRVHAIYKAAYLKQQQETADAEE